MTEIKTYATHFCGVGGACRGLELAGLKCAFAIDNYDVAVEYRKKNLGHQAVLADITEYEHSDSQAADLLWTSPPCQTFSKSAYEQTKAKAKLGVTDKRDNLFLCSLEYVKKFKPKFFVLENVVGLLSHVDALGQATKDYIIRSFADAGYHVEWNILCSADFGVPQLRERLFIVGALKELGLKGLIPDDGSDSQGYPLRPRPTFGMVMKKNVTSKAWKGKTYKTALKAFYRTGRYISILMPYDIMPTITCGFGGGATRKKVGVCDQTKEGVAFVRHPTIEEGALCQGFPRDWKWPRNQTEAWTLVGNAVTVDVSLSIASHLIALSNGESPKAKRTLPASRIAEFVKIYGKEEDQAPMLDGLEYNVYMGTEEGE